MAGFFKVSFISEHFTNTIVNVLHYRSEEWLPGQGNPFDDVQNTLSAVVAHHLTAYRACLDGNTRILRAEAVGYNNDYNIVTSSPLVQTINETGTRGVKESSGSFISATVGLRCGEQLQINGIGRSKRNRGYLSVGPVTEDAVDSYGHLVDAYVNEGLTPFANAVKGNVVVLSPSVTLIPVRIHEKYVIVNIPGLIKPVKQLLWRTYSDVLGYTLPRLASVRRSRMGEA